MNQTLNLYTDLMNLDWVRVRNFTHIVIHSSDTEDGPRVNANAVEKWHKENNGWSEVGYHFLVEQAPEDKTPDAMTIWNGRSLYDIGAHAEGFNTKGIGVCCIGDYDNEGPDGRHWETTAYVCQLLKKLFKDKKGIELDVIGHREVYPLLGQEVKKTCPGAKWDMDLFRKACQGV